MAKDQGNLFGFADVFDAVYELIKKVKTDNSAFLLVNGSENSGKTALLNVVEKDLLHEDGVNLLKVDLLEWSLPSSLAMIAIFEPYLTTEFPSRKIEFSKLLSPFREILWNSMPDFCERVWQIERNSDTENQDTTLDETTCFTMLCKLLQEDPACGNSIVILVDNADSDDWQFLSVFIALHISRIGVIATTTNLNSCSVGSLQNRLTIPVVAIDLPSLVDIDVIQMIQYEMEGIPDVTSLARTIVEVTDGNPKLTSDVILLINRSNNLLMLIKDRQPIHRELAYYLETTRIGYVLEHYNKQQLKQTKYLVLFSGTFDVNHVVVALGTTERSAEKLLYTLETDKIVVSISEKGFRIAHQSVNDALCEILTDDDTLSFLDRFRRHYSSEAAANDVTLSRLYIEHISKINFDNTVDKLTLIENIAHCFYNIRDYDRLNYCLEISCSLIKKVRWDDDYSGVLQLINLLIEYSLLPKNNSEMTFSLANHVLNNARLQTDKVVAIDYKVQALKKDRKYTESIEVATDYLGKLGYNISANSNIFSTTRDLVFLGIRLFFSRKKPLKVAALDSKKNTLSGARIMRTMIGPVYMNANTRYVLPRLIILGMRLTEEIGVGPGSTYARLGLELLVNVVRERVFFLQNIGGKWTEGNAKLVVQFDNLESEAFSDPYLRSRTGYLNGAFKLPLRNMDSAVKTLLDSYEVARSVKDWEYMGYSSGTGAWYELFNGEPLSAIAENMNNRLTLLNWVGDSAIIYNHQLVFQFIANIENQDYDFDISFDNTLSSNNQFLKYYALSWISYAANDSNLGYQASTAALRHLDGGYGLPNCIGLYFFHCRFLLDVKPLFWKLQLLKYLKITEFWAKENPKDFDSYLYMMKSYVAASNDRTYDEIRYCISALKSCRKNNVFLRSMLHREKSRLYNKLDDTNASLHEDKYYRDYYEKWSGVRLSAITFSDDEINSNVQSIRLLEASQRIYECSTYNQLVAIFCEQVRGSFAAETIGIIIASKTGIDLYSCKPGSVPSVRSSTLTTAEIIFGKHYGAESAFLTKISTSMNDVDIYLISSTLIQDEGDNRVIDILMHQAEAQARLIQQNNHIVRSTEYLKKVSDAICIITSNSDGVIVNTVYNEAFTLLVDVTPETKEHYSEELFKFLTDQLFGDSAADIRGDLRKNKNISRKDFRIKRKNGDEIDVVFSAQDNVDSDNKISTYFMLISDRDKITIENNIRTNKEMFGRLTHEIRTPATAVSGFLDITLDNVIKKKPFLEDLKNAMRAQDVLLETLSASAGALETSHSSASFNLNTLFTTLVANATAASRNTDVEVLSVIDVDSTYEAKEDKRLVKEIVQNLLANATKFTHKGKVIFNIQANEKDNVLSVWGFVKDTGIGIAKDKQNSIFNAFQQVDGSVKRKYGGTGMGLSLVKKNCEKLDGNIRVSSEKGEGSVFTFRFNLTPSPPDEFVEMIDTWNISGLLVEDDPSLRETITYHLNKLGIKLDVAEDGFKAIEKINSGYPYDVVFMDINLPGLDGFETTIAIRKNDSDLPIIAITAAEDSELQRKAASVGMQGVLSKPISNSQLSVILSKHFKPASSVPRASHNMDSFFKKIDADFQYIKLENIRTRCTTVLEAIFVANSASTSLASFYDLRRSENNFEQNLHKALPYIKEVADYKIIDGVKKTYELSKVGKADRFAQEKVFENVSNILGELEVFNDLIQETSNGA